MKPYLDQLRDISSHWLPGSCWHVSWKDLSLETCYELRALLISTVTKYSSRGHVFGSFFCICKCWIFCRPIYGVVKPVYVVSAAKHQLTSQPNYNLFTCYGRPIE